MLGIFRWVIYKSVRQKYIFSPNERFLQHIYLWEVYFLYENRCSICKYKYRLEIFPGSMDNAYCRYSFTVIGLLSIILSNQFIIKCYTFNYRFDNIFLGKNSIFKRYYGITAVLQLIQERNPKSQPILLVGLLIP